MKKIIADLAADLGIEFDTESNIRLENVHLELAPATVFGKFDVASNIAMLFARLFKMQPTALGGLILDKLLLLDEVDDVEVVEPGFINIKLALLVYCSIIKDILANGASFGFNNIGKNEKINIEYVSANPTGPLHVGHVRGAIYGDVLSSVLSRIGFDVTKEYYVNDGGSQIDVLLDSALLRYKQVAGNLDSIEIPPSCYPGEYLVDVGKEIFKKCGRSLIDLDRVSARLEIRQIVLDAMISLIKVSLSKMKVRHDVFVSEESVIAGTYIVDAINVLREKDLCYVGKLDPPKGVDTKNWVSEEQELFKSSKFGDDSDRPLKKSDGSFAYFAPDIGYHYYKYKRGFSRMILVLGADHKGYVKRISAAVNAISDGNAEIAVKLCELVNFIEDGRKVKSSKRSGKFVTADSVINELGADVLRFMMLTRKNDTVFDFDLEKAKLQSKDNPLFYVQYAHSRCASLLRSYEAEFGEPFDLGVAKDSVDLSLLPFDNRQLANFILYSGMLPVVIDRIAKTYELHLLINYVTALAAAFHGLWNGDLNSKMRFIDAGNKEYTRSTMMIVHVAKVIISSVLLVIGVEPLDEM